MKMKTKILGLTAALVALFATSAAAAARLGLPADCLPGNCPFCR